MAAAAAGGGHAAGNAGAGRIGCAPDPGREAAGKQSVGRRGRDRGGWSPFSGALIAALHSGRRKLLCGLGAAGGYALFLLLGNLLFFGVHYEEALPVLLPLAGAGLLGALLGAGRRKKRRYA